MRFLAPADGVPVSSGPADADPAAKTGAVTDILKKFIVIHQTARVLSS
jgi:hypothetical protein